MQGLDGKEIDVEVDFPGGVIRPGDISRVVGAGMPIRRSSEVVGRGDMLIKCVLNSLDRVHLLIVARYFFPDGTSSSQNPSLQSNNNSSVWPVKPWTKYLQFHNFLFSSSPCRWSTRSLLPHSHFIITPLIHFQCVHSANVYPIYVLFLLCVSLLSVYLHLHDPHLFRRLPPHQVFTRLRII